MRAQSWLLVLCLLGAQVHAQTNTPAHRAAQAKGTVDNLGSGANPSYFQSGKDFANSPSGNAAVKASITGSNAADKVPQYSSSHEKSSLFMDGNGNLAGPGASRVNECAVTTYDDPKKQYECDAVNDVARNRTTRPSFTITPSDPLLAKGKAVKNELKAMVDTFGDKYSACQTKTITEPDTYSTEVCADILGNEPASCVYGRKIVIDADSNFQCDQTVNAYETHKCRRWPEANVEERCDASTPSSTFTETVSAEWWWCGDSCEPRADTLLGTFDNFARTRVGLTRTGMYKHTWHCLEQGEDGFCYGGGTWTTQSVSSISICQGNDAYSVEYSGSPRIALYMDGVYQGSTLSLGYDCMNLRICYGEDGVVRCFGKSSRKPMINFRASVSQTKDCTNKVWICHHKNRYPCHWACRDPGVLCTSGTLTQNTDGSYSCLSNCRNELIGVTWVNECAALEARSIP